jgi:hypothetical protein
VLPHEITVANDDPYTELQAEMGDWVEDDDAAQDLDAANAVLLSKLYLYCVLSN